MFKLFYILWNLLPYNIILIQNPPCVPVLFSAYFVNILSLTFSINIVVDWHNLGYSMFNTAKPSISLKFLIFIVKQVEMISCRIFADSHLSVSSSMKDYLSKEFNIKSTLLYDRPFRRITINNNTNINNEEILNLEHRHNLLLQLNLTDENLFNINNNLNTIKTIQTENSNDNYSLRQDKSFILVSSTSWTPDEDFNMLLISLLQVDQKLIKYNENQSFSKRLVVLITGKGPLRDMFENLVKTFDFKYIRIKCLWLTSSDYPKLLSCADIGLCLHTSTSGLDLPMKALDMLGVGLPVLAINFPALSELIKHGENGIIFEDASGLATNLLHLMSVEETKSVENRKTFDLSYLRNNVENYRLDSWDENWNKIMIPMIADLLTHPKKMSSFLIFFTISILILLSLVFYNNHKMITN